MITKIVSPIRAALVVVIVDEMMSHRSCQSLNSSQLQGVCKSRSGITQFPDEDICNNTITLSSKQDTIMNVWNMQIMRQSWWRI